MMGYQRPQPKLFYQFSLDDRVPANHILRQISEVIDFSFVHDHVRPFYSHTGAPSVDPVVIFKMALLGYLYGITSERKLAEECRLNLAFMWFLGYDIDEMPPDHSILSKARARFGKEVYEQFFRHVVRLCKAAGLIEGNKLFFDATLVKANASLDSLVSRQLYRELKETPEEYLAQVWQENPEETTGPDEDDHPDPGNQGKTSAAAATGTSSHRPTRSLRTNEKWVSRTDPDASLITYNDHRGLFLAHKVHIAVDGGKARIVTAVTTTPGATAESQMLPDLVGKHFWNTKTRPAEAVADRAYGTRAIYRFLKSAGIRPSIPIRRPWKYVRKKRLLAGFRYDRNRDVYVCPRGKLLYRFKARPDGSVVYRVHRLACRGCPYQATLCKALRPSITHHADEELLSWVKRHLEKASTRHSLRQRSYWPETVFAEMKGPRGLCQATLRGNAKVHIQALLALAAHNIRQLVKAVKQRKIPAKSLSNLWDTVFPWLWKVRMVRILRPTWQ